MGLHTVPARGADQVQHRERDHSRDARGRVPVPWRGRPAPPLHTPELALLALAVSALPPRGLRLRVRRRKKHPFGTTRRGINTMCSWMVFRRPNLPCLSVVLIRVSNVPSWPGATAPNSASEGTVLMKATLGTRVRHTECACHGCVLQQDIGGNTEGILGKYVVVESFSPGAGLPNSNSGMHAAVGSSSNGIPSARCGQGTQAPTDDAAYLVGSTDGFGSSGVLATGYTSRVEFIPRGVL